MDKTFNDSQVITALRKLVKGTSYRKAAGMLGMTAGYVQDVVKGRRGMSENLAKALGYKLIPPSQPEPRKWERVMLAKEKE